MSYKQLADNLKKGARAREIPSREAIEMEPKLIIKARKIGLMEIRFLNPSKHLGVNLELLAVVPGVGMGGGGGVGGSATAALNVILNRH